MRYLVGSLLALSIFQISIDGNLIAQNPQPVGSAVSAEQALLEKLRIFEEMILRRLRNNSGFSKTLGLSDKSIKPFINSLRASLLGKPFQSAFPSPSFIIKDLESPENQAAALSLLVELSITSGNSDKVVLNPRAILNKVNVPGINREAVLRVLMARLFLAIEANEIQNIDRSSLSELLESFSELMATLEPVSMKGWTEESRVMNLKANDLKTLYAKLYVAMTRIGEVEAPMFRMQDVAAQLRIPDFAREEVRSAVRRNVELLPESERPAEAQRSALIEKLMPQTFEAPTVRAIAPEIPDPLAEYRNFPRLMSGAEEWKRWNETYQPPTAMDFEAVKILEGAAAAASINSSPMFKVIEPYFISVVKQLRAEDVRDPFFSKNHKTLTTRQNAHHARSLLLRLFKSTGDLSPDLTEAYEYVAMNRNAFNMEEVENLFWNLTTSMYGPSAENPSSTRDLQKNLEILSQFSIGVASDEHFTSFYKTYLMGMDALAPELRQNYLKTTAVHPVFTLRLRKELIKTLGDRIERVDYDSNLSKASEAVQQAAYLAKLTELVKLSLTPHSAEKVFPMDQRNKVLEHLIQALQSSGTDLGFEEIQFLKQAFGQDPNAQNQRDWESHMERSLLASNIEVLKQSKTAFGKVAAATYKTMKGFGVETRMLRGHIPTVKSAADLMLQFQRVLPRTHVQLAAGQTNYEPNYEQAHGYTTADAQYHMYLAQLWNERAKDLSRDFQAFDSHELLMMIVTLKNLISEFPKNKPGAPQIDSLRQIEAYAQTEFPKNFESSLKATIAGLVSKTIYSQFYSGDSADEVLENLQSIDFTAFEIAGLYSPREFKIEQRRIMLELLPEFMAQNPMSSQIAEYAWLYSKPGYSSRPKLKDDGEGGAIIEAGTPFDEFIGAIVFDPNDPTESPESRLKRMAEILKGEYLPFEEVEGFALADIRKAMLIQAVGNEGIPVQSMKDEELKAIKSLSGNALKLVERNGSMMIVPTRIQAARNFVREAREQTKLVLGSQGSENSFSLIAGFCRNFLSGLSKKMLQQ